METTEYTLSKEQNMLKCSYMMYEKSIKETEDRMKSAINKETGNYKFSEADIENQVKLLRNAQDDIVLKYIQNGGKETEIRNQVEKSIAKKVSIKPKPVKLDIKKTTDTVKKKTVSESIDEIKDFNADKPGKERAMEKFIPKTYDNKTAYDVIPLPSNGQCYPNKLSKVPVSFLTAYDENMIVSPNLYRDNLVLDYILENKIMNDEIDPSQLLDGDREAIILYLRASGYGNEYPIMAKDDKTGKEFEATIDLSDIKFKEFNLVGDENGYFDFELPVSKKKVKFKFLNHSEVEALDKLNEIEEKSRVSGKVNDYVSDIEGYLDIMDDMEVADKVNVRESLNVLKKWSEKLENENSDKFSHYLTNKLELSIVSIDGNKDREYISDFVNNMPVRDSTSLRKYILKNEPGLDYNLKIEKPESLGGGSMDVFLQFDQFIFLNIPK